MLFLFLLFSIPFILAFIAFLYSRRNRNRNLPLNFIAQGIFPSAEKKEVHYLHSREDREALKMALKARRKLQTRMHGGSMRSRNALRTVQDARKAAGQRAIAQSFYN